MLCKPDNRQMALKDIKPYRNTVGRQCLWTWESVGSAGSKYRLASRHKVTKVVQKEIS